MAGVALRPCAALGSGQLCFGPGSCGRWIAKRYLWLMRKSSPPLCLRPAALPLEMMKRLCCAARAVASIPMQQQGIDSGAFRLLPSLEISSVVTSNAARSSTKADADVALGLRPSLRWESEWSRHSFSGAASVNAQRYLDNEELNAVGADLSAAARIDIRRTTRADLTAQYSLTSTGTENSERSRNGQWQTSGSDHWWLSAG